MENALRRGDENRPHPHGFASTRLNGTHPFPAPSLRELSSERETEGVYYDEWKTPFVGAMKIARTPTVSGRPIEWYPPPQPSPAPSLRELSSECETEGVSYDERNRSKITEFICAGS